MHIIAGLFKNRPVQTPKGLNTRPTSNKLRGTIFNICQTFIDDADFLDLFAGSGAMGLEALSRGAKSATFIDHDRESIKCIKANLEKLGIPPTKARVIQGDVFSELRRLSKSGKQFDVIYVDPPYEETVSGTDFLFTDKVLSFMNESPLLAENGSIFIEEGKRNNESREFPNLKLESSRKMGRSMLHHYIKTGSTK